MGVDLSQWRAAIGCFGANLSSRKRPTGTYDCCGRQKDYPYECDVKFVPADILKLINQHRRFACLATRILPRSLKKRKELFNALISRLLLLVSGIESNPGPKNKGGQGDKPHNGDGLEKLPPQVTSKKSKTLKRRLVNTVNTIQSYFKKPKTSLSLSAEGTSASEELAGGGDCSCLSSSSSVALSGSDAGSSAAVEASGSSSHETEADEVVSLWTSSSAGVGSTDDPDESTIAAEPAASASTVDISTTIPPVSNDIGLYVANRSKLDDATKFMILTNSWMPPSNYTFPYSVHKKLGKVEKRYVGRQHFEAFHWLVLSDDHQGLYCKYCVIFANETGGHQSNTKLGTLVNQPLTIFSKLTGKTDGALTKHENRQYHKDSVQKGRDFIKIYSTPTQEVSNLVNAQRLAQVEENRQKLRPIVETVVFAGRYGLPLRGHRDDGPITKSEPEKNDGVFRGLLRYRMNAGDSKLERHLELASSRQTYCSKTIQNEIIDCCRVEIQEKILKRVRKADVYAIIFDETTDEAHLEQLSLSLRYIYKGKTYESFLAFCDAYEKISEEDIQEGTEERRLTGVALGNIVVALLREFRLPLDRCVGVGTDNCSVMASVLKGAAHVIQLACPFAIRCPCCNHTLNSSLSKTADVRSARTTCGIMKKVIAFANASAKRNIVFKESLGRSLTGLCETRWCEKHDGTLQFKTSLKPVITALTKISTWADSHTSSEATCLIKALCDIQFITSTVVMCDLLEITRPLSLLLQSPQLDLKSASDSLQATINVLQKRRDEADSHFKTLFEEIKSICEDLDVDVKVPRTANRQLYRDNHPSAIAEDYYRTSMFIPLLDVILTDLQERLSKDTLEAFGLNILVPSVAAAVSDDEIAEKLSALEKRYGGMMGTLAQHIRGEFEVWRAKWNLALSVDEEESAPLPNTGLEAIDSCDEVCFPAVHFLLRILATLPVSVASAERSFSTLRRLKTWLRTRMGEDRLTGLALLNVHFDIHLNVDDIVERFAKLKARRLQLIL